MNNKMTALLVVILSIIISLITIVLYPVNVKSKITYPVDLTFNSLARYTYQDGKYEKVNCEEDYQTQVQFNGDTLILTDHIRNEVLGFKPMYHEDKSTIVVRDIRGNSLAFMRIKFSEDSTQAVYIISSKMAILLYEKSKCLELK